MTKLKIDIENPFKDNVCWEAWGRPIELGEVKQLWNNIKSS